MKVGREENTMIRPIMKDPIFLSQRSAPATAADLPVAQDLRDTLEAHRDGCVGMAANMIGVARRIIIFDDNGGATVMFNPEILKCSGAFEAEEGCLSLPGTRRAKRYRSIKVRPVLPENHPQRRGRNRRSGRSQTPFREFPAQ